MRKILILPFLLFLPFLPFLPANAASTVPVSSIQSGDLIRGQTYSSIYYYGADGMRYVFPNDKTYFTWYSNFDSVKWLTDKDLATIQIGGNVTYKPGIKMIKINSDPKVYAVAGGGTLRHVSTKAIAIALYGSNWNKQIDDVPDGFFPNYTIGSKIEFASQYSIASEKSDASDINTDKNLKAATVISIKDQSYEPSTATIESGHAVRWVNNSSKNQSTTEWDSVWGSGTLEPDEHFTRYFFEKGTWNYHSKYTSKSLMGGALIVK